MITVHQHYIPRAIVKRWSYHRIPMSNNIIRKGRHKTKNYRVWYRNVLTGDVKLTDIRDICYKDNLYEYQKNGINIDINLIENQFSLLEDDWADLLDKLDKKTLVSISDKNVIKLKHLIIKQFMRTPVAISVMKKELQTIQPSASKEDIDRYCKISSFVSGIPKEAQFTFLMNFNVYASTRKLGIFYTDSDLVLCVEQPVLCIQTTRAYKVSDIVLENICLYLPISPHCMLGLLFDKNFNNEDDVMNYRSEFINLDTNATKYFNNQSCKNGTHIITNNL